ncbi:MAG: ATP-dependent helicase [Candidatus Adiutrix sp.]|nr:ATP-dependent helicase [Candidatus Adiutrix sp.]
MRRGEIQARGGFDGQYGTVTAIGPEDRAAFSGQGRLFEVSPRPVKAAARTAPARPPKEEKPPEAARGPASAAPPPLLLSRGDLLLDGLDGSQVAAVTSRDPVLCVVAGPGSGKTRVLVHRAAWLLRENLVRPEEMLLTTFTRKAAEELAPRLAAALPFRPESGRVRVSTLHALAYDILKKQRPDWELAPEDYLADLLKKAAQKAGLKPPAFSSLLSLEKNSPALRPGESGLAAKTAGKFSAACRYYQQALSVRRCWDFDDLILEADPDGPPPFKAILVDEFQDLSAAQFSFLKRLRPPETSRPAPASLTVIGDPEQSIYAFRGARREIFDWLKIYSGLRQVELTANYRATRSLILAGEALMAAPGRPRRLAGRNEAGPRLTRAVLSSPRREAAYVTARLRAHLGVLTLGGEASSRQDAEFMPGLALSDIAVIFRLRSQGAELAAALDQAGLAWQMSGEEALTAADDLDFTADKISLLTMHAAKGLEFRLVFIVGAEEGLCPYFAPSEEATAARLAEEKRLFYVALTRARDRLYLTRAAGRRLYGRPLPGRPSPFWDLLPPGLCRDLQPRLPRGRARRQPTLFD